MSKRPELMSLVQPISLVHIFSSSSSFFFLKKGQVWEYHWRGVDVPQLFWNTCCPSWRSPPAIAVDPPRTIAAAKPTAAKWPSLGLKDVPYDISYLEWLDQFNKFRTWESSACWWSADANMFKTKYCFGFRGRNQRRSITLVWTFWNHLSSLEVCRHNSGVDLAGQRNPRYRRMLSQRHLKVDVRPASEGLQWCASISWVRSVGHLRTRSLVQFWYSQIGTIAFFCIASTGDCIVALGPSTEMYPQRSRAPSRLWC